VLVFAGQRAKVEELVGVLVGAGYKAAAIHGDMDQVGGVKRVGEGGVRNVLSVRAFVPGHGSSRAHACTFASSVSVKAATSALHDWVDTIVAAAGGVRPAGRRRV
jgi:hypothetical protein